jgi:hypothetical protein
MDEPTPIEGVKEEDLAAAASELPSLPNTRADDADRFAQAIRALLERRAQAGWPNEADESEVSAFVLVPRPREFRARFCSAPVADPVATSEPVLGRVLLLTRDAGGGQVFPLPCETGELLDWLIDQGFGAAPVVIAYRPTATMITRHLGVDGSQSRSDPIRDKIPTATADELEAALAHFAKNAILTPTQCIDGVWEPGRAGSYVPGPEPEKTIQKDLVRSLNFWFHGTILAEPEDNTSIGRIDVRLLVRGKNQPLAYWAIVELKVIKSFANAPPPKQASKVARSSNINAIVKGMRQAWAYRANRDAELGLLEVYDMRKDKSEDLTTDSKITGLIGELSPCPPHVVRPLYGSADDARLAGETGV